MKRKLTIGTRRSRLALIQTESVADKLKALYPNIEITIKEITTAGDRDRNTHLDWTEVNVFVKELEQALLDGKIDIAVHSLKDMPTDIQEELKITAVTEREDPRDALVAKARLEDLPPGSAIGTGSLRRTIQLALVRPNLKTCGIRGNVDTRLRKVSTGEVDGIIVAAAGLKRLGCEDKITQYLSPYDFLPAVGQGAIAIEARMDDKETIELVEPINHQPSWQCILAERTFLSELGGGCRVPIAVLGTITGKSLRLECMVASIDETKVLRDAIVGDPATPEDLGSKLADKMMQAGAENIINYKEKSGTG